MCERDSPKAAFTYQRTHHASEEHNPCKYMNTISHKKVLPVTTNMELPFVQSTMSKSSEPHDASSSLAYNVDVVNVNCNSSSNTLKSSTSSTSSAPQSSTSIGVNLRVTGQCSQGGRKYMEDYFSVAYQQSENANDLEYAFVGIYDGHGGAEAATFAKEHLMMEIINQKLFWSDSDQDVLRAIREGYIATHYAMWRDQENWPKTSTGLPSTAGTTATVAFIRREKIYIGHVGDSGIVLGYQNDTENFWRAKPLTTDHKPESLEERTRIMRSGGKVIVKSGVPRVVWSRPRTAGHKGPIRHNTLVDEIPFLAVARSLGDLWSYNSERNEFVVSPDPDVKVIKINPKTFRCLIFGTDGLWNVVSPQEAVDCVYEKETLNERLQAQRGESRAEGSNGQWTNPSKGLVNKALKTWAAKKMRADNTSVVTVILYPPGTPIEENSLSASCHTQSYGLEYTQVNAEVLTNDESTTYAELATKYKPPEQYRNFKYNDGEPQEPVVDPLNAHYEPYAAHVYAAFEPNVIATGHDYYHASTTPQMSCEKVVTADPDDESDDDEDEDCEEDSDDSDGCTGDGDGEKETLATVTTYASAIPGSKDALQSKLMEQQSLDYMNSFAESYTDSLLGSEETIINANVNASTTASLCNNNDSDSTSSSNSSSSASFHSAVYQHDQELQHELLVEHQLYQAQCMSQEEGYSLTKLETRVEQQMRNGTSAPAGSSSRVESGKEAQTFQIFQQQNEIVTDSYAESNATSTTYNDASKRENVWDPRFPALCRFINSYEAPKLELNSLLQQEMEEEQQVAMERLEMQRRVEQQAHQNTGEEPERSISAEYLEEELITESADVDASIQINEISSSMESPIASEEMEVDTMVEEEEIAEESENTHQHLGSTKNNIVLIEKIEILQHKPELVIECSPSTSISSSSLPLQPPTLRSKLSRSKPTYNSASTSKLPVKALINPSPSKRPHFPNVPNENQRISLPSCSPRTLRHCTSSTYASMQRQRTDNRQLRSMAPPNVVDYSKRTLRSRNSLSKDMKAKATLNLRRSTSLTNQYLRTTPATLLAPNATQQQQLQTQLQQRQRQNVTHQNSVTHLPMVLRHTKSATATALAASTTPCSINLRSRQIVSHVSPVANAASVASSTPVHHLQQRREKRNLRSLSAKAVPTNSRHNCKESNSTGSFSKATRLQSTAANLAAPPPSPKLICVAKRATLRSGSTLINTTTAVAVSSTLQTRSRVQKHINR